MPAFAFAEAIKVVENVTAGWDRQDRSLRSLESTTGDPLHASVAGARESLSEVRSRLHGAVWESLARVHETVDVVPLRASTFLLAPLLLDLTGLSAGDSTILAVAIELHREKAVDGLLTADADFNRPPVVELLKSAGNTRWASADALLRAWGLV